MAVERCGWFAGRRIARGIRLRRRNRMLDTVLAAVADPVAHKGFGSRAIAELFEGVVHRGADIRRGVDQRAVEIEQVTPESPGIKRHGRYPGRRAWR